MKLKKLIAYIENSCKDHGIELVLRKAKHVMAGSTKCNGCFNYETGHLVVATKVKFWELILVHEYAHMTQWLENCREWAAYRQSQIDAGDLVDSALCGARVDKRKLHSQLRATMMMERDCERRAVVLLQTFGYTEIKTKQYIQKANAYTIFYLHIEKTRKWYKMGSEPYNKPSIWKHFPETFDVDVDEVYKDLRDLYEKCF
jgi:hypothetical protein